MRSANVLLGVLAGIFVGAALGILFAPDKGAATRKKISRKSDAYAEELSDNFNEFIESITNKFETLKDEACRMAENGNVLKK